MKTFLKIVLTLAILAGLETLEEREEGEWWAVAARKTRDWRP